MGFLRPLPSDMLSAGRYCVSRSLSSIYVRTVTKVPNLINGEFRESSSNKWIDVINPATQEVVSRVPESTQEEMLEAVTAAEEAFKTWSQTSVASRSRIMFRFRNLIEQHTDELAQLITREQGKTIADAKGDIFRGLEVVEHSCSTPTLMMGETSENVSKGMDTYSYRQPVGVYAGITPFNFPAMIPLWMFPLALTTGNTFVMKPSEVDPGCPIRLCELAMEAGVPAGVLNVIHGTHDAVNFLCDEPRIKGVSFVGSNIAAKNHACILPDANKESVLNQLAGAAFGAAGQRCMALSTAVFVGEAQEWLPEIVERAKKLVISSGTDPKADLVQLYPREQRKELKN